MSKHAKAPWDYYYATMGGDDIAVIHPKGEPDDYRICLVLDEAGNGTSPQANARHIVHCVNNHERLVEMLYEAEGHLRTVGYHYSNKVLDEKADKIESLLLELEAEKGGGEL